MSNGESNWHLSKGVPISLVAYLLVQTIALVIWGTRLDYRVNVLEGSQPLQDARLGVLESLRDRLIIVEQRQNNVIERLNDNGKKLDALINKFDLRKD